MNGHYFQRIILSGTLVLALGACVHKPTKSVKTDSPIEATSPPPQQIVLLQEARSEAQNMRAELAGLKILMAKQAGELRSLREQSQSVHHREQDQGRQLQDIRSQLLSSQAERDQLRKQNMELKGQVVSMPDTSQLVSDIQAIRRSFQNMMISIKGLVSDITLIKQEMRLTTTQLKPQQTKLTKSLPAAAMAKNRAPDAKGRIIIQERDTLWQLSRTYHVSVEQLRAWNTISSDLIVIGLRLKVAEPAKTVKDQPGHVKTSTKSSAPLAMRKSHNAVVKKTPPPAAKTPVIIPSEPTHILSIAPPQPDSHESP